MEKKIVIWDLFGGGQNSVRKALKEANLLDKYEVYTFDIVDFSNEFTNLYLNFTSDNVLSTLKEFLMLCKPDIIIASPPCETWTKATISKAKDSNLSGNHYHYQDKNKEVKLWKKGTKLTGFVGKNYPNGITEEAIKKATDHEFMVWNLIEVLKEFKPKYWYIENPANSFIWDYIKYNLKFDKGIKNIAHYSAYNNEFSKKPTCFLSNIDLQLKKNNKLNLVEKDNELYLTLSGACKNKQKDLEKKAKLEKKYGKKVNIIYKKNAMERSEIPKELIINILKKFKI